MRLTLLRAYAGLLHLLRPNAGLTKLSFNPVTNRLFAGIEGPLVARMPAGLRIEIEPNEYHGRILWLAGSNDWRVSRTVNALLCPADVFLDIGANLGSIGLAALPHVGRAGMVHLFEPQTDVADRLEASIKQGGLDRVQVHRVALSDSDGQVTLAGPANHRGMATIMTEDEIERPRDRREVVEMRNTETYLKDLVDGRNFGVKIDIEGAEPKVLPGIVGLTGLRFVVFEGANYERWLWDFFTEKGFAIYGLVRRPVFARVAPVSRFDDWKLYHDFVAVRARDGLPERELLLSAFASKVAA